MGMAERQYSVSLPLIRQRTGPKPMEKRSTSTRDKPATTKWPHTGRRWRVKTTTTKQRSPPRRGSGQPVFHEPTRLGVHVHARPDAVEGARRHAVEGASNEIGDLDEADVALEEGGHGDFVGGVQDRGRAAPGRESLASQPEAREAHGIGRFEC